MGSQFAWHRNPIPPLAPSASGKDITLTDVEKWLDGVRTSTKAAGGAYVMDMYDEYVKRGISLPQVHPQQPDRSPCNPRQWDRLDPADYTSFAFKNMIVKFARDQGADFSKTAWEQTPRDVDRYYRRIDNDLNSFRAQIMAATKDVERVAGVFNSHDVQVEKHRHERSQCMQPKAA